ncbi:hypothetical protein [Pseudomonas marginalis]|uniref:hypothetical protein n=1 Tax=Pseudomonas marginalis TaxID=298 RepID=UPI003BA291C5
MKDRFNETAGHPFCQSCLTRRALHLLRRKTIFDLLLNRPSAKINQRFIAMVCNFALDTDVDTFTFTKTGAVMQGRYSIY